jgi:hypothetical protein
MGRTGFSWLRIEFNGEFCEHGNEPSGSIQKEGYCLTRLVTNDITNNVLTMQLELDGQR